MHRINHSCIISRWASIFALFGFAMVGLLLVVFVPNKPQPEVELQARVFDGELGVADTHIREVDISELIRFCTKHTTAQRGFVIFRNGTCVLIPEPASDPAEIAKLALEKCAKPEARFLTEKTKEGDLIVTFEGPVFHLIPKAKVKSLDRWTLKNQKGLLSELELATVVPDWAPPVEARLGLLGRKRLRADAQAGDIVKILRPNTAVARAGL